MQDIGSREIIKRSATSSVTDTASSFELRCCVLSKKVNDVEKGLCLVRHELDSEARPKLASELPVLEPIGSELASI
jgi:hypothetical protein